MLLAGPDSTQVESEVQMYLLALKNALLPESIPVLAKYAESEVGAFSTIAITALQRYDPQLIKPEVYIPSSPRGAQKTTLKLLFKTFNTISTGEKDAEPHIPSEQAYL